MLLVTAHLAQGTECAENDYSPLPLRGRQWKSKKEKAKPPRFLRVCGEFF
jgi:hypothetical protein